MPTLRNRLGERYGRLVVIERDSNDPKSRLVRWKCKCDCGNIRTIVGISLTVGNTRSCGCLLKEWCAKMSPLGCAAPNKRSTTHGKSYTHEYHAWQGAKKRCSNPRDKDYFRYGGRGISMCSEWLEDFEAFYGHIGPCTQTMYRLDRIDNDGNYEPGNVRWTTPRESARNRRPPRKRNAAIYPTSNSN